MRIVFDSVFFVFVGLVLMNIITGLMVEFFSSARRKKRERAAKLENECFICGLTRAGYQDAVQASSHRPFDAHLAEDHNLWSYVYFAAYLRDKDPTEDSGIESYVRSQVNAGSLKWFPSRTFFALESLKKE